MATYTTPLKGKPNLNYEGFNYVLGSIRKDNSEVWKCLDRNCEARLHRKTSPTGETLTLNKHHTVHIPTISPWAVHLGLLQLKTLALDKPNDDPTKVITYLREKISDTLIACMPSPHEMNELILSWRKSSQESGLAVPSTASPLVRTSSKASKENNEGSKSVEKKAKTPKKRRKLNPAPEDDDDDYDMQNNSMNNSMNSSMNRSLQARN